MKNAITEIRIKDCNKSAEMILHAIKEHKAQLERDYKFLSDAIKKAEQETEFLIEKGFKTETDVHKFIQSEIISNETMYTLKIIHMNVADARF